MLKTLSIIPLLFLVAACMGTGAPTPSSSMPAGRPSPAPAAYLEFCKRSPSECAVPYSTTFSRNVQQAHNHTKTLFVPTVEEGDYWQILETLSEGDCEDFALTLRAALRKRFPGYEAAFRIATAYTESNDYHAVLSVETSQGTLICDNRFPDCASWESFPYRWKLREVSGNRHWESLTEPMLALNTSTAQTESGD